MSYKEQYENLVNEFEQYKKESIKWSVEDFLWYDHDNYTITESQAQEALEDMIKHHDAELGISWVTIETYIEKYGTKKEKRSAIGSAVRLRFIWDGEHFAISITPTQPTSHTRVGRFDVHYSEDDQQVCVYADGDLSCPIYEIPIP